jgi:hypothetical protein
LIFKRWKWSSNTQNGFLANHVIEEKCAWYSVSFLSANVRTFLKTWLICANQTLSFACIPLKYDIGTTMGWITIVFNVWWFNTDNR